MIRRVALCVAAFGLLGFLASRALADEWAPGTVTNGPAVQTVQTVVVPVHWGWRGYYRPWLGYGDGYYGPAYGVGVYRPYVGGVYPYSTYYGGYPYGYPGYYYPGPRTVWRGGVVIY